MKIDTLQIIEESVQFSKLLQKKLKSVRVTKIKETRFKSGEFRNKQILKDCLSKIDNNDKTPIIYIIRVDSETVAKKLVEHFQNFWCLNVKKIKNKDRVNVSRFNKRVNKILYVGSSTTNFKTRIQNHLGVLGSRVYSLHLSKWDSELSYSIIVDIFQVDSTDDSKKLERFVVEILEQQIWEKLKPTFGKKSGL